MEGDSGCYFCQKSTDENGKLRSFNDRILATVKNVANMRKKLKTDKYCAVTKKILSSVNPAPACCYHSACHRNYTAVKHPKKSQLLDDETASKKPRIGTRCCSALPKSDKQGMLKGTCIFCRKSRKKRNGKEEPRMMIAVPDSCSILAQRAQY